MIQLPHHRWRPNRIRDLLWVLGTVASLAFMFFVVCGYLFGWKWTGIVVDASYPKKTLWDWLDLLIVPAVLAIGGYLFSSAQNRATLAAAERRAQDEALQAYLDRMGQLLIDKGLRDDQDNTDLRQLARDYTLTVLGGLDGRHKRSVIRFLHRSRLICVPVPRVMDLNGADLTGADLEGMRLCSRHYNLEDMFGQTDLSGRAERLGVDVSEVAGIGDRINLWRVDLSGANLRGADLGGAILIDADLSGADLSGANLHEASLRGARGISAQPLHEQCKILVDATMPNGQKYEDWLEDREGREEGGKKE